MLQLKNSDLLCSHCFIQDSWAGSDSGKTVDVTNPATGEILGTVPYCGADETKRAIDAANESLDAWRSKTAGERSAILRKWQDLLMENQEDLAMIMTAEQGKPLAESRGEIAYAAGFFEWFAEEAKRVYGDVIPQTVASQRLVVIKQPVGVVAAITPWNFPSAMITRKAGAALAAGCTMVVKPATATPFSALAIAKLGQQAGVPKGVFNVVTGSSAAIGGELTSNPVVRKLTFTGSTEVGKKLMRDSSGTMKRLSMELGGNAPFIVFDDADIDAAVEGAMASKYRNFSHGSSMGERYFYLCRILWISVPYSKPDLAFLSRNPRGAECVRSRIGDYSSETPPHTDLVSGRCIPYLSVSAGYQPAPAPDARVYKCSISGAAPSPGALLRSGA
jgi:succinate-semialdehyde dehydrogenase/glutarate-semialdehyde dehydrogenase